MGHDVSVLLEGSGRVARKTTADSIDQQGEA